MTTPKSVLNQNFTFLNKILYTPDVFHKKYTIPEIRHKACFSYNYIKYGFMDTWEAVFEKIQNLPEQHKLFNELLTCEHIVKPYLDIEWYREDFPTYDPDKVKIYLKDKITEIFKDYFDVDLLPNNLKVSSCHRNTDKGYKYSYHIVIHTISPMYVFQNTLSAIFLANKLRDLLKLDSIYNEDIIDKSVYKSKQNIRLVGQYKSGDYTNCFKKDIESDDNLDYIITNISRKHCILTVEEQEDDMISVSNFSTNIKFNEKILEFIMTKVKVFHPTAKLTSTDSQNFLQFNYTDRAEKCFCHPDDEIYHEKIGFFVYINKNNIACAGCHSNRCLNEHNQKIIEPIGNISYLLEESNTSQNEAVSDNNDFSYIEFSVIKECVFKEALGMSELLSYMFLKPKKRIISTISRSKRERLVYIWNGDCWEEDKNDTLFTMCVKSLGKLLDKTRQSLLSSVNDPNITYSSKSTNSTEKFIETINKTINLLNAGGPFVDRTLKFFNHLISDKYFHIKKDIIPYIISCKNGIVDLKTKELRKRQPEDWITEISETQYNPEADYLLFDNFIRDMTSDVYTGRNDDRYNFMRWCIGQSLTRDPQKLFIIVYNPVSYCGKSTFQKCLKEVFPTLSKEVDATVLLEAPSRSRGSHTSELMALQNIGFAFTNETKKGQVIEDAQVKRITGRDTITGREIYKEQTTFDPVCVPWIFTNEAVGLNLRDQAMYNRTVIFKLPLSFVDDPVEVYQRKRDITLEQTLLQNKEGILRWFIECGFYYCENMGVKYPDFVNQEKDKYLREIDIYTDFIDRYFEVNPELNSEIKESDAYSIQQKEMCEYFKSYCTDNCEKKVPKKDIIANLDSILESKEIDGNIYYIGIKIKNEELLMN